MTRCPLTGRAKKYEHKTVVELSHLKRDGMLTTLEELFV